MGRRPVRIAAAGDEVLDVEKVLGGEGKAFQGAARSPGEANVDAGHEGAERIGHVSRR